jgi:MoaA/NifB/PqqE/SkfB family radical SAM enzyme
MWKIERGSEMKPEDYALLPPSLTHINLSGGEPYLRDDLPEIYAVLREKYPKARIVISTNGLMPRRTRDITARMPSVAVRVSIDALGEANDEVRGVPGSYTKAMETLRLLEELGVKDLGVSSTLSRGVEGHLGRIMEMVRGKGMEFTCGVTHSSPIYFGDHNRLMPLRNESLRDLDSVMRKQLGSWRPKEWFRAYMTSGLMDYVELKPRRFRCTAIRDFFYLDAAGIMYPCNMRDDPMGSLLEASYPKLVEANPAIVQAVRSCPIDCWMSCTVAPTLRRRPWIALPWVMSHKAKSIGGVGDNGNVPVDLGLDKDRKRVEGSGGQ